MSKRIKTDVLVVGAGMIGLAVALALVQRGLDVRIVDQRWPAAPEGEFDLRVVALSGQSIALLDGLGVWPRIAAARIAPYRRMQVIDGASDAEIVFDARDYGWPQLGVIVENQRIAALLAERLGAQQLDGALSEIEGTRCTLTCGTRVDAQLVIGADGAGSPLRERLLIDSDGRSYAQSALVAHVRCERPQNDLAWQRFLTGGPLAFLPLPDRRSSIVWSVPTERAARLMGASTSEVEQALQLASGGRFGAIALTTPMAQFPLRWHIARHFAQGNVVLIGDAAHTVHPLAGQGVNLGFADVACLLRHVDRALQTTRRVPSAGDLQRYSRERRSETMLAARAFDALNALYAAGGPWVPLRSIGLSAVNRLAPIKRRFAEVAAGIRSGVG